MVAPAPPANTAAPTVTGDTRSGQTVTADPGSWSGTPTLSYAYQWRSCDADSGDCADIAGATGQTFVLTSAEVARRVSVRVTATNAGGNASVESAHSRVVTNAAGEPGGGGGGGGGTSPSGSFSIQGARSSSSNGRATITVNVPGPGILALIAASPPSAVGSAQAAKRVVVTRILRNVTKAGRVKLVVKPSRKARAILMRKRKLRIGVKVSYTPAGGTRSSLKRTLTLRLKRR